MRVLGEDGKQVGVMQIGEAMLYAKGLGVDLIEIVPGITPPVVKAISIGKFKYQEEKRQREQARKQKGGELKEIRFTPFIGDADFETRYKRIEEFLEDSNKVRVVVIYQNKQLGAKQSGYDILSKLIKRLEGRIVVDSEPKFLGRRLMMVISPYKKKIKKDTTIVTES